MKKISTPNDPAHHIAVFQETTIRRVWHNEEWWFAIVDVVSVLTDSADPRQYIKKMRSRDPELDANWGTSCTPLALQAADGKQRETNCANTEGLFRIIQSIPSPKASEVQDALSAYWFDVLALSVSSDNELPALTKAIRIARKTSSNPRLSVMVGGPAFLNHPDLTSTVGADGYSADAEAALHLAVQLMQQQQDVRIN